MPHLPEYFLIVDDDVDSSLLAVTSLRASFPEADFLQVRKGQDALSALQRQNFTAIVTDYRMPEMDGITLIRLIRQMDMQVPIVMRTAMEDMEEPAREAGADLVLPWFRWRELGHAMHDLLHCHSPGRDSRS